MIREPSRSQSSRVGIRQQRKGDIWNTEIVQTEKQMHGVQSVVRDECYSALEKERSALLIGVFCGGSCNIVFNL
jgi:hypothetical protein